MKTKDNKNSKKPYKSPELIVHGSIEEITKAKEKAPKKDGTREYSQL